MQKKFLLVIFLTLIGGTASSTTALEMGQPSIHFGCAGMGGGIPVPQPTPEEMEQIAYHKGIEEKETSLIPGGYIGFKYAISPKLILQSELGFSSVSIFKVGIGYRLK